ncbi:MAG: fumarate hydratase [bacterium]|nr:fumarate hydratase [bacterium]
MREINASKIRDAVKKLYLNANYFLPKDVLSSLKKASQTEIRKNAKSAFNILVENASIAENEGIPLCQDTGLAIIFAEIGQDVHITGGGFEKAVNDGIRQAVKEGYLRASVVKSPINRINTKDNAPAIIHTEIVPGNKIKLTVLAKGGGAENMSAIKMLKPSDGVEGIKDFVLETVKNAGPNPCPPIVVGVGIGGNFEKSAYLAKKALLRDIGKNNKDKDLAKLERELLQKINKIGIGPCGIGGKTTGLAVNIESLPCHIASLPVAVNIECHSHRHKSLII